MSNDLSNKVAIITGAASGMGLATARLFVQKGAKVVMTDITEDKLVKAAETIGANDDSVLAVPMDVSSEHDWTNAVKKTVDAYNRIDILVNCAGIVTTSSVVDTTESEWERLIGVNAKGVWLGMKSVIPHMQSQGKGAIVNVASIAGLVGDKGGISYTASKGAALAMTKQAAKDYAKDSIRVNAISPGLVFTGMTSGNGIDTKEDAAKAIGGETPLPPHVGDAEDIAYGAAYLASDDSKFVTGANIVIDGGWTSY